MNYHTISLVIAFAAFLTISLVGLLTAVLREEDRQSQPYAPFSFSRFQLWLWTLVITPLFTINWGYVHPDNPEINETSLILLSISGALTLTSAVITQVHVNTKGTVKLTRDSKNFFYDILTDDKGQFSIGRLQNLVFTFVFVAIYIIYFFGHHNKYVDFHPYVYTLMGISTSTYLFGKAMHN